MFALFRNLSISKKFVFSLISFVVVPLIVVLILINMIILKQMQENAGMINLEVLKQSKSSLNNFIQDMDFVSMSAISDPQMQSFIKQYDKESADKLEQRVVNLRYNMQSSLLFSRKYISGIAVFQNNRVLFRYGNLRQNENNELIPSIAQLKGKTLWTPAQPIKDSTYPDAHTYEISQYRAINDLNILNNQLAYQRVTVNESYIRSLYEWVISGQSEEMFVINELGQIISATQPQLLGTIIADQDIRKKLFQRSEGFFKDSAGRIISFYAIKSPHWIVVKVENLQGLSKNDRVLINIIVLCLLLTLVFGAFFGVIQNRTIIKPITQLSRQASNFREGHYKVETYSSSNDEIGTLNRSLGEMMLYVEELIEEQYKSKLKAKEAELMAMQSHINPHFLYNSLDSIRWMCMAEQKTNIAKQVEALSKIFRHALNMGKSMTTIDQEIDHLQNYILIQKNRYLNKLNVSVDVDKKLMSHPTLKLILQPLVENAIVHGLEKKIGGGNVYVQVYEKNDIIYFKVADDGLGSDEEKILVMLKDDKECHNVFALKNIDDRVKHQYGDNYGIEYSSIQGKGTTVLVSIPLERGTES
ncbi:MAG: sensor histidine kinase [Vallitaleaceae bacterium]|nr:sensor histidine kinase [Vallitaleaceae bacterium]